MSQKEEIKDNPQESDLFLEEHSEELQTYISKLKKDREKTNPKYLCAFCWCLLNNYQRMRHVQIHETGITTPKKFCEAEDFKLLAKSDGHTKLVENKLYFMIIKNNPSNSTQITQEKKLKKIKINKEESKENEFPNSAIVNVSSTTNQSQSLSNTSTNFSNQEQKTQVKFLIFNLFF